MKVKFKKYESGLPPSPSIDNESICLCECPEFCEEGAVVAKFTEEGFVFSGHGNIDQYVTGYVVLELPKP